MKIVWTIVALLLLGGLIVLMQPPADTSVEVGATLPELPDLAIEPAVANAVPAQPSATLERATNAEPPKSTTPPPSTAVATAAPELGTAPAAPIAVSTESATPAAPQPAADAPKPSTEAPKPSPEAIAAGSVFEPEIPKIEQADILPSRFVRLPDGSISVDDAWTVRGEGTEASPYEVSWEYISSAQETYVPRLGEKAIPARIAFLSGKRVRISGYLAFPLIAPTASECLVMLNQWDGCCIGIPPTPYDAVEVKLAEELKGWRKHTINFGAVEGTFKVDPYLVENWLVGLYLLEGARINREL